MVENTAAKSLTFCIDWMRSRAEHTPMPASRATMESIVARLEELESLKTADQQAERPRANGDAAPVVHGRWERDADGDWYCTNCDEIVGIRQNVWF